MGKARDSGGKEYLPSRVLSKITPQVGRHKSSLCVSAVNVDIQRHFSNFYHIN